MAMGLEANHLTAQSKGLVSFAFVPLAALSTFAMVKSDRLTRAAIPWLKRLGCATSTATPRPPPRTAPPTARAS